MGTSLTPSSPKDPPKPTINVLNILIAGRRASNEKNENPQPREISSKLQDCPSSWYNTGHLYDKTGAFSRISFSSCNRCLHPLAIKHFRWGFLRTTWPTARQETWNSKVHQNIMVQILHQYSLKPQKLLPSNYSEILQVSKIKWSALASFTLVHAVERKQQKAHRCLMIFNIFLNTWIWFPETLKS